MTESVAIVGAGNIGCGWIKLFISHGIDVAIYDADEVVARTAFHRCTHEGSAKRVRNSQDDIVLMTNGARVRLARSLASAIEGATYVQESLPESIPLKQRVFRELDELCPAGTILASSVSSIPADLFMDVAHHPARSVVVHPFNPPDCIPLVEVVRSSWTSDSCLQRVMALLDQVDQDPIILNKSVIGYAINRIQAVVLWASLAMVEDGLLSPADMDKVMKSGLARRWCFIGPFETSDLNSQNGFSEYCDRFYDVAYHPILKDMGIQRPWSTEAIAKVEEWRRGLLPDASHILARSMWRDRVLGELNEFIARTKSPEFDGPPVA